MSEKAAPTEKASILMNADERSDSASRRESSETANHQESGSGPQQEEARAMAVPLLQRQEAAGQGRTAERTSSAAPTQREPEVSRLESAFATETKPKADRIELQLEGPDHRRVQIDLVERRGGIHIALRAAGDDTAARIRESLPELAGTLRAEGFHAETWRPQQADGMSSSTQDQAQQQMGWHGGNQGQRREQPAQPVDAAEEPQDFFALLQTGGER
jgi:hypothetical protein